MCETPLYKSPPTGLTPVSLAGLRRPREGRGKDVAAAAVAAASHPWDRLTEKIGQCGEQSTCSLITHMHTQTRLNVSMHTHRQTPTSSA